MTKVKVDMTDVESFTRCEEGKHPAVIKKIELKKNSSDDDMLVATVEVTAGESKGARVIDNYTLTAKALWKLKQVLESMGMKADGKLVLDTDKMLDKPVLIEVAHETYNGTVRAKIQSYSKVGSTPAPAAAKGGKEAPVTEKADEDDDWDEA